MNRASFERVIRSCCRHLGRDEVVVIGSQALYGAMDELPMVGVLSMEVDVLLEDEDDRDDVAGLLGELSQFHQSWGVYADPVDITTGRFPDGWTERLVAMPVEDAERGRTYRARCAELHDLCVAKLVAGRDKDRALVSALFVTGSADAAVVTERLGATDLAPAERELLTARLDAWARPG